MSNTKNDFLSALKENLSTSGVHVNIAGKDMIVIPPTTSQYREYLIVAEERAKDELRGKESDLRKKKISAAERKELRETFKALGSTSEGFVTEYDRDLIVRRMNHYSKLIIADAVRYPDGTKTWNNESERFEVAELILSTPGAEESVRAALEESQKKRAGIGQSTTSPEKPSKE